MPAWAPAIALVLLRMAVGTGPLAFQALRSATFSAKGRRIRRRVARLASTHSPRSSGSATGGGSSPPRPVNSATARSAVVESSVNWRDQAARAGSSDPPATRRPTRAASCQSTSSGTSVGRAVETTAAPGTRRAQLQGYASAPGSEAGRSGLGAGEPGPEANVERDQAEGEQAPAGPVDGRAARGRRGGRAGRLDHRAAGRGGGRGGGRAAGRGADRDHALHAQADVDLAEVGVAAGLG